MVEQIREISEQQASALHALVHREMSSAFGSSGEKLQNHFQKVQNGAQDFAKSFGLGTLEAYIFGSAFTGRFTWLYANRVKDNSPRKDEIERKLVEANTKRGEESARGLDDLADLTDFNFNIDKERFIRYMLALKRSGEMLATVILEPEFNFARIKNSADVIFRQLDTGGLRPEEIERLDKAFLSYLAMIKK